MGDPSERRSDDERRIRLTLERERVLQRVTQGLARDRTVQQMAETVLDGVDIFGAMSIYVGAVDHAAGVIERLASRGLPEETIATFASIPLDAAAPIAEAARTGATVTVSARADIEARFPSRAALVGPIGIHAIVVQPVLTGEQVGACISLAYDRPHRPRDEELTLLETLARLFGQAIERAHAYEAEIATRGALERAMSRLSRLQAVTASLTPQLRRDEIAATILEQARSALRADAVGLFLPDGVGGLFALGKIPDDEGWDGATTLRQDSPLAIAEAFRTGHTVWVPTQGEWRRRYPSAPTDYHSGAAAVLAVPLVVEGEARGVLGLLFRREHALGKDERRLATTIGHHAAQALERARLYESERQLAERTAELQRIAGALAAAATPAAIAEVVEGAGLGTLGAVSTSVAMVEADGLHIRIFGRHPGEDDVVALEPASSHPGVEAIQTRGPVVVRDTDRDPDPHLPTAGGERSWVGLPLLTDREAIGFVTFGFAGEPPTEGPALEALRVLAAQTAQAMDRARLFAMEHEVARVLQESLMPPSRVESPTFEVSTRYQPGADHLEVGGDWFDVMHLPGDRLGIAVGDVVGRGLHAAAAMGQLRSALSALALQDVGPIRVMDALEAFAERTTGAQLATVVYGELDPDTGEFRFCSAGHPPPLLEHDGEVQVLEGGRSPLLAAGGDGVRPDHVVRVPPGGTIVLYSDGLVERRGETFDRGIQRLGRALRATTELELEERADEILGRLLDGVDRDDDVALLCVRRASDADRCFRAWIPPQAAALGGLRHRVDAWLRLRCLTDEDVESAVLALNEAAANAIEHGAHDGGGGEIVVTIELRDEDLEMRVHDRGRWRERPSAEGRGRGLVLMHALMDDVQVERANGGTTVTLRRRVSDGRRS
ncbi:MAG: SpoIIE family protein phosphatase [Planctomycetaceae bacterium]